MRVNIYGHDYTLNEQLLRRSFSLKELANNKGDSSKAQFIIDADVDVFLDMLQEFRDWFNKPMVINSCYRQESWNAQVGGNPKSAHLRGTACDWGIKGHTTQQRENVKSKWRNLCCKYKVVGTVILYTNGYHLEAFSDKCYGQKDFKVLDKRGTSEDW